jgi:dipeptidyl peptidase-like protein
LTHAYRKDLADVALASRVISSHYAEPLARHLVAASPLLAGPADDAQAITELKAGDEMRMLDMSLGWAWGYAPDGRVGYVRAEKIGI